MVLKDWELILCITIPAGIIQILNILCLLRFHLKVCKYYYYEFIIQVFDFI